jgi:ribonuclease VapC
VLDLGITEAAAALEEYLEQMEIDVVAVPPSAAAIAIDALDRYGKGRDAAGLNFGDSFAYACARHLGPPLMFKGADFPLTDIEAA